jgi:hypothetical protein
MDSLLRFQRENRQERDGDDEQAEKQRRPDFDRSLDQDLNARFSRLGAFEMLVRVLDHDNGSIDHRADRDRDPAKTHDVGTESQRLHRRERHQDADRKHQDRDQRTAHMQQEHDADQSNDRAFLHKGMPQIFDCPMDQGRAVIDRRKLHPLGQAPSKLGTPLFHVVDHIERVGAEALQHDAARDFALAIEFGQAAPFVGSEFDARHVRKQHRRSAVVLEHDLLQIGNALQVSPSSHHEFKFGKLDRAAPDIHVAGADDFPHFRQRNVEAAQTLRVDHHIVLFDEAPDTRDFRDAFRLGQAVADKPVLHRAQLGEGAVLGEQRILVNPADAGRIGSERRRHPVRKAARGGVEIFEHARTRPINVGAVFEDHVNEGNPEVGEAAHYAGFRHREHGGCERVSDLILDHLRRLSRIFGVDDHLGVGEVGDRIERDVKNRIETRRDREHGSYQHQHQVAGGGRDQPSDHGGAP